MIAAWSHVRKGIGSRDGRVDRPYEMCGHYRRLPGAVARWSPGAARRPGPGTASTSPRSIRWPQTEHVSCRSHSQHCAQAWVREPAALL